jgi:hypothetical protein
MLGELLVGAVALPASVRQLPASMVGCEIYGVIARSSLRPLSAWGAAATPMLAAARTVLSDSRPPVCRFCFRKRVFRSPRSRDWSYLPADAGLRSTYSSSQPRPRSSSSGWAAILTMPRRHLLRLGVIGNAVIVLIWLASRTVGLPVGPAQWSSEALLSSM